MRGKQLWLGRFVIVVSLLTAAACGGAGNGGSIENPGDQTTVQTGDTGDTTTTASDAGNGGDGLDLPSSLTIAVMDGGKVTGSTGDTGFAFVTVEYPLESYDELVTFYRDWSGTDARDWSESDTTYDDQGTSVKGTIWRSGASSVGVSLCRSIGGSGTYDATCVIINQTG